VRSRCNLIGDPILETKRSSWGSQTASSRTTRLLDTALLWARKLETGAARDGCDQAAVSADGPTWMPESGRESGPSPMSRHEEQGGISRSGQTRPPSRALTRMRATCGAPARRGARRPRGRAVTRLDRADRRARFGGGAHRQASRLPSGITDFRTAGGERPVGGEKDGRPDGGFAHIRRLHGDRSASGALRPALRDASSAAPTHDEQRALVAMNGAGCATRVHHPEHRNAVNR